MYHGGRIYCLFFMFMTSNNRGKTLYSVCFEITGGMVFQILSECFRTFPAIFRQSSLLNTWRKNVTTSLQQTIKHRQRISNWLTWNKSISLAVTFTPEERLVEYKHYSFCDIKLVVHNTISISYLTT